MKVGDKIEVEITSVGMDGEGVARVDGFVVFVPKTLQSEKAIVEITQVKKTFAFAKVIKLVKASSERINPPCDICFKCGGCEMLHISYPAQLKIKHNTVKNCIDKECAIESEVKDVIASPNIFNYRNKIQLPISRQNGRAVGGYFAVNSHLVVPSSARGEKGKCVLNSDGIQGIIDVFLQWLDEKAISVYEEQTHKGIVRHLVVRKICDKFSICVVVNSDTLPHCNALVDKLKNAGYQFSLYISINKKRTNVILGEKTVCLYGEESIIGETLGVKFSVSVPSFMQINDEVRNMIYTAVGNIIESSGIPNVIDAYSGIGIMSNIFAKHANKVYAIEIVEEAVKDGIALANLNGNTNKIKFICGDCAKELPKLIAKLDKSIVVLDPPRKGCDIRVLDSILQAKPTKIVYISCNPSTLARDLKHLLGEYSIESITPYDMFPHTKHIETLACLKLK